MSLFVKISLIIAVYKDIEALELIFKSLELQTYKNFEVIVAEDGESQLMRSFIAKKRLEYLFDIIHTTQVDNGVQKSKSQNNAIKASRGEYLIFIDGDCLLYSKFIEYHMLLSGRKNIVTGRRVNLGPRFSTQLRDRMITSSWLEKNFVWQYLKIKEDSRRERHSEEGFQISPHGLIHKAMKKLRKKNFPLLGCNMSFYKSAILEINGFDEGLGNSAMASDTDLEWRFKGLGYKIISGRYIVNEFHLYHMRNPDEYVRGRDKAMYINQQNKCYRCKIGIIQ